MSRLFARLGIDPYLLLLIATVIVAAIVPVTGEAAHVFSYVVFWSIFLLFFLYGAKLSTEAVVGGIIHWRLQGLVLLSTFAVFPVFGLALRGAFRNLLPPELITGLMLICVLPSTVQSSIAFTSIARGNVPAALCAASASNLFGMLLTPALVALLMTSSASGLDWHSLESIALQLFLPFVLGQLTRRWVLPFVNRHKEVIGYIDRSSILLVVYAAFSEGMAAGIWSRISLSGLGLVILLDCVLLALVIATTTIVSRRLGFSKEDEIVIVFCGSKKSLAGGIPMANILLAGQSIGLILLPLMLFHQIQLFVCATMAQRYATRPRDDADTATTGQREPATA
jgi:sodium/bile acid cotransporter 7